MKLPEFHSAFSDELSFFLKHREEAGVHDTSSEFVTLRRLDQFMLENCPDKTFSKGNADAWMERREDESPQAHYRRINLSKLFFQFLFPQGYKVFLFEDVRPPKRTFVPHIYTREETERYFLAVDTYDSRTNPFHKLQLPVLFRILYCCGTRITETLMIRKKDVDLEEGIVLLSETKNKKKRYIVLSDDLLQLMKRFADRSFYLLKEEDYIFRTRNGTRLSRDTVDEIHRRILHKAGIPYQGNGHGPRLHDWRHTMAVMAFKKMADEGTDMYVALPMLSTYLGHSTIMATEYYLRLTMDLFPSIKEKMEKHFAEAFKGGPNGSDD